MASSATLLLSGLGIGGLLTLLMKAVLDKREYRFSKIFDFKGRRYQAILILMWTAMNPAESNMNKLKDRRPLLKQRRTGRRIASRVLQRNAFRVRRCSYSI